MIAPTPPRRFRFGLRSLFVLVTVICVWLGWSLNWIRQRHAAIGSGATAYFSRTSGQPVAPGCLWLFGEKGVVFLGFSVDASRKDVEQAMRLFPETPEVAHGYELIRRKN